MLKKKQVDDIKDELDEFEEDEFTKQYLAKRMEQIKVQSKKPNFGSVIEISRSDYIKEVNEAPAETFVFLHLYQNYNENSNLLNQIMNQLAAKYTLVKFIKIVATNCVEKFPDSNVPAVFIYKAGQLQSQLTNFDRKFKKFTPLEVEKFLHHSKIIFNEDFVNEEEDVKEYRNLLKEPFKNPQK